MNAYRIDLKSILDERGSSIDVDDTFEAEPLTVGDECFTPTAPTELRIKVTNTGHEVIAYGSVRMQAMATCVRCLCEFPYTIDAEVSGLYVKQGSEASVPEEQDFEYIDSDETVDLMPAIIEALVLEAPFAPLHDQECRGLCPTCGVDLNSEQCSCVTEDEAAHPFSGLKGLLGDLSGEDEGR